jgi:DNA-binding GntR family transcriptional regulator
MRDLLDRQNRASKQDAASTAALNKAFRDLVHQASRNRFLISALETLEVPVAALPSPAFATSGHGASAHRDHVALLKAIEGRDADRAAELSAAHMRTMARLQILMLSADERGDDTRPVRVRRSKAG